MATQRTQSPAPLARSYYPGETLAISLVEHEGGSRIVAAAGARALVDLLCLPGAEHLVVLLLAARQAAGRFDRGSPGSWLGGCFRSRLPFLTSAPLLFFLNATAERFADSFRSQRNFDHSQACAFTASAFFF